MTSNRMRNVLSGAGLALFCLSAAPSFAQEAKPDTAEMLDSRTSFVSGEAAWHNVCARCHTTVDARSDFSVGPDLSAVEYDADTLRYFIRNGAMAMPAFPASALDDATIDELAAYMAANVFKGDAQ